MTEAASERSDDARPAELLREPRDGLPDVVDEPASLAEAVERLAGGRGPVAVDAERASGYRYGNRAYLVQLRRADAGTIVVDPVAFESLGPLAEVLREPEWVVHAATQDLPCLAEVGLRPTTLFDTELAGRLLGYPRVALGTLVESLLGYRLEKEHAAVDWSVRPLPDSWVRYAALDVELLLDLRSALTELLQATGKDQWAVEEFAAVCAAPAPAPREDPWRRTSGMHRVHKARELAVVRELWLTRDRIAARRNLAPGRVLPDAAIIEAALAMPGSVEDLVQVPGFGGRATRRHARTWYRAVETGREAKRPPSVARTTNGPPPARTWAARSPEAAARLAASRAVLQEIADEHDLPVENLLLPDSVRRLAWEPPELVTPVTVRAALEATGARSWQVELTAAALAAALGGAQVTER